MLFFQLFLSLSLSIKQGNLQTSYPVERYQCGVNLDGEVYNLSDFFGQRKVDKIDQGGYTFYIKYCSELTHEDVDTNIDLTDVYAVRCDDNTSKCIPILTSNSWDWHFYNVNNKSTGIIYYGRGEPNEVDSVTYYTFDLDVEVVCNAGSKDPDEHLRPRWDDIEKLDSLTVTFHNFWGCPKEETTPPTPTPNPFEPDCKFFDRYDPDHSFAVDMDLTKLNGPPFGIKSEAIRIDERNRNATLFYQPCERMFCPLNYKCPNDTISSAWLCYEDSRECDSYGLIKDQEKYIEALPDLLDGVKITFPADQGNSMTMIIGCNRFLPNGHIKFDKSMTLENNQLTMKGESYDACVFLQPDPTPQPKCYFTYSNEFQKSTITLNLTTLDKPDNVGWTKDVDYKEGSTTHKYELMYQPCDNIHCPDGYSCEGDEDATIYLCNKTDASPHCVAYGVLEKDITLSIQSTYDITEGVRAEYLGDIGRTAIIDYQCDSDLAENQIRLPDEVTIYRKELSFTVYSKQACGTNNPQPRKPWHPPTPTPPTGPTPTPQPSVNPVDIYVINDTHYIITSLAEYSQDPYRGNLTIYSAQSHIETHLYGEFHPYQFLPCPDGYICSAGHDKANFWLCWTEDNGSPYCHSIGDIRILNDMKPMTETNPDHGVNLMYGGVWGLGTTFEVLCNPRESSESIPFDRSTVMFYSEGSEGPKLQVVLDSGAVCPRAFKPIPMPSPSPRITPRPDYTPTTVFNYNDKETGMAVTLDLNQLEIHDELITIGLYDGAHPNYQRNLFRYYPKDPGTAPEGYTVLDNDNEDNSPIVANVWRCFNNTQGKYCHTCGNINIDLDYKLVDDNISHGLQLNYEGGYGGYESIIQLICNESVQGNTLDFDDVGVYVEALKQPIIFAHTSRVCPYNASAPTPSPWPTRTRTPEPSDETRSKVTGGAVFLTLVVYGLIIYLAVGVLFNYIRNGSLDFPNTEFWQTFFECVQTAVYFIFTCGHSRGPETNSNLYEKA